MEPFRKSKNNSEVNSKYDSNMHSIMHNIIHSSRVLTIPLIRCDDVVFDRVVKQEFVDDTDRNDENQFLQMGAKREFEEEIITTDTVIKIEKDYVLEGSVKDECHSSELIAHMDTEETAHLRQTFSNSDTLFNSKALITRPSKIHTRKIKKVFICDNCEEIH